MNIKYAILAAIGSSDEGIKGRTLLQKKMYFLGVLVKEDFQFSPYYYGPYSSTVSDHLGALREAGFVSEQVESYSDSHGVFGELRRFDYGLTKPGHKMVELSSNALSVYKEHLVKINAHPLSDDPKLLSIAAKVHFIVHEHGRAAVSKIHNRAREFGWNLMPNQVEEVVGYLEHLGLVRTDEGPAVDGNVEGNRLASAKM